MVDILNREGRGAIFDRWIEDHGKYSRTLVRECVKVYRHHEPKLELNGEASKLLPKLSAYPKYIVTDGHKVVQEKKIRALKISAFFRHIYITHRYGLQHVKPSIYCFEKIRQREKCNWRDMIYVGDNPDKDFVNLNPLGVQTVRVLTGIHKNVKAQIGYDACHIIPALSHFQTLLKRIDA